MRAAAIDDNPTVLTLISRLMTRLEDYEILAFADPIEALKSIETTEFDIVLIDYMMPQLDGISTIRRIRMLDHMRHVPIIMVTSEDERATRIDAIQAGATDFLTKPIEPVEFKARVHNLVALRQAQLAMNERAAWLAREVARATRELLDREQEMIWRLARAVESRDGSTGAHITRMAQICRLLADSLGLDPETALTIHVAAPLHDIGKIGIADAILAKPGPLTDEERRLMQEHVSLGEHILHGSSSDLVKIASQIVATHHERWDGAGYPRGLSADAIPLVGRIASVADVFDALVSDRPYKKGWEPEKARQYIIDGAGKQFDPRCVEAFDRCWPAISELYDRSQDHLFAAA